MRWSLILSVFVAVQSALSCFCAALAVPPSLDGLEKRASRDPAKLPSKAYRENSKSHPDAYHVQGLGPKGKLTAQTKVTKTTLQEGERHQYGHNLLTSADGKKLHADHVFEVQMLHDHLHNSGFPKFENLNEHLKHKLKTILNGPENMAIIPASINQSKGQLIKHGMKGKQIKRNKGRDEYALKSYDTAHKTAGELDKVLKEHGHISGSNGNLQDKLRGTFVAAGLLPGSPGSSRHSSPSSSSRNRGQSNSRQSNSRPSTPGPSRQSNPGPSSSSPKRGRSGKRNASPGNSPPRTRQRTGRK